MSGAAQSRIEDIAKRTFESIAVLACYRFFYADGRFDRTAAESWL